MAEPTDASRPPATEGTAGLTERRRLFASGVLGIAWIAAPPIAGTYLILQIGPIGDYLRHDPRLGFWAYVAVFAVSAGLGILPTYAQAVLGGWVFGMWAGLGGALMGFVGGAAIGMLFSRAVAGSSIDHWIEAHPRARLVRRALVGGSIARTFAIVTLIRLPPNSPFAITNLALGTTGVNFWLALAATAVGMLPRTAIACFLASQIGATGAKDLQQFIREQGLAALLIGVAVMAVVVAIIGSMAKAALARMTREEGAEQNEAPRGGGAS